MEIDIYVPSINIGIEYDGYIYHKTKREFDDLKTDALSKEGIRLIRIREVSRDGKCLPELKISPFETINYFGGRDYNKIDKLIKEIFVFLQSVGKKIVYPKIDTYEERFVILHNMYSNLGEKSLEATNSRHLIFWDKDANKPITPMEITGRSGIEVFWKCPLCSNTWKRTVFAQLNSKGCPYCTHSKPSSDYNFESLHKELLDEWDYDRNIVKPSNILPKSHKKYYWKCGKCGNEYLMSPADRSSGCGCSVCGKEKSRKGRCKAVLQISKQTNEVIARYESVREAEKITGIRYNYISKVCTGIKKSAGGYFWRFDL